MLPKPSTEGLLGASWVVISGVITKVTILITLIRGLITPPITTHEPPSMALRQGEACEQENFEVQASSDKRLGIIPRGSFGS